MDYQFTNHLRQRYVERFRKKKTDLNDYRDKSIVNSEILQLLKISTEDKSYLNDTNLLTFIYEKYGYDRKFFIRVTDKILFIIVVDNGKNIVTTCFPRQGSAFGGRFQESRKTRPQVKKGR